ncbi:MAG: DUF21 domain-containing protein [Planctomycetes bacterium]|nr:DUF21 domain-containing protein [Planctomycetota bacterium]
MSDWNSWIVLLLAAALLVATAVFEGSETGLYSLSRLRVESDARSGRGRGKLIRRLLGDESALLATILIGTNLAMESLSRLSGILVGRLGVPEAWREVALTVLLTPLVFFFAELLPKDLFRRRPHALVGPRRPSSPWPRAS